ncbi:MAG TPA: cbb3-type cytochrome c oxidase subunit II [Chthoniobacterales bacterium]|jgi:cytochrome c oxidase cbb3-type subunit 2
MKGLTSLFLGVFATFAFSWLGLALVPNSQIGHLDPQADEDGTDTYPMPPSGMVERGRKVYTANGCVYCHSQQVRPDYDSSDIERKWGTRRSAPRDYIFSRPVLLGTTRMGPDLSNIGKRAPADDAASPAPSASPPGSPGAAPAAGAPPPAVAPPNPEGSPAPYSAAWHHQHLYAPRSLDPDSNMPAFRFLYQERRISGERADDALNLTKGDAPPTGWEVVPTFDAKCLVAFLLSLDQSHPLKEVKSGAPPAAPAPAPGKAAAK